MSGRLRLAALLAFVAPLLAVRPAPADTSVSIVDFAFQPASVTVLVGSTVTWTNNGGRTHTVTDDTLAFDSGLLDPAGTFAFPFTEVGTYTYHCIIHGTMQGTVRVIEASSLPDLEVSLLTVADAPTPIWKHITAEVRNNGVTDAARSTLRIGYVYQNTFHLIADLCIPNLDQGQTWTEEVDWDIALKVGTFPVKAIADATGAVVEFAEDNNTRDTSTAVIVAAPAVDVLEPPAVGVIGAPPIDSEVLVIGSNYAPADESPKLPEVVVAEGQKLFVTNLDSSASHTLISKCYDGDGLPIFTSPPPAVGFRARAEIAGVPALPAGLYGFYCTLHPGMAGTLIVRPRIGG